MLLSIEGVVQQHDTDCGPSALYMILRQVWYRQERQIIEKEVLSDASWVTYTIGLARAAAYLWFSVLYFTKSVHLQFPKKDYKHKLIATQQEAKDHVDYITHDALLHGVGIEERICDTEEMKWLIVSWWYCIVLCEYSVIENKPYEQFRGHFLVVVWWNEEFIILTKG